VIATWRLQLVNVVGIYLITVSRWYWAWQLGSFPGCLHSLVILNSFIQVFGYYCR